MSLNLFEWPIHPPKTLKVNLDMFQTPTQYPDLTYILWSHHVVSTKRPPTTLSIPQKIRSEPAPCLYRRCK